MSTIPKSCRYIDVITDAGEERDDEVGCAFLNSICCKRKDIQVRVFCTNPKGKARLIGMIGEVSENYELYDFTEENFVQRDFAHALYHSILPLPLLIQIGPVMPHYIDMCTKYADSASFAYILLGELGKTLNSNKSAKDVADMFFTKALQSRCVHTRGGDGAPNFTVSDLASIASSDSPLVDHVLKIGFRNTMGRAGAFAGKFVAHLVSAFDGGANYQTCKRIAEQLGIESHPETWDDYNDTTRDERSRGDEDEHIRRRSIMRIVDRYISDLCKASGIGLVINEDGSTNSIRGVSHMQIRNGYAYILDTMNQAFGFPIDFFASQTPDGKWDKRWEFSPEYHGVFNSTYSEFQDEHIHTQVMTSYENWKKLMKKNPHTPTTPAYDVVAIRLGIEWVCSKYDYRFKSELFEELSSTDKHAELLLSKTVKNDGVERILTSPLPGS